MTYFQTWKQKIPEKGNIRLTLFILIQAPLAADFVKLSLNEKMTYIFTIGLDLHLMTITLFSVSPWILE